MYSVTFVTVYTQEPSYKQTTTATSSFITKYSVIYEYKKGVMCISPVKL